MKDSMLEARSKLNIMVDTIRDADRNMKDEILGLVLIVIGHSGKIEKMTWSIQMLSITISFLI